MAPRQRNLIVGSVVLVALVALGWMILRFSSTSAASLFNKGTDFRLYSERVDGVSEGSPIFYLGVNVGRVKSVRRVPEDTQVVIEATIDSGQQPLPRAVVGVIRQTSPLGSSASISLEPDGSGGKEFLKAGDTVPARFLGGGVVPPEFSAVATEIRQQQLVKHVDEAVVSFRTQVDNIGTMVDQLNKVLGDQQFQGDIKTTLANVRQTSDDLKKFTGRLDELATETKATVTQVRTTVADGGQRFDVLAKDLGERLHQVGDVLGKVQGMAAKVEKGEGTAGALVNDPRLYESLVDTSRELNETVKSLKRLVDQWEQDGLSLKMK